MIKKFQNCKLRTQFVLIILSAGLFCYILFSFLWGKRYNAFYRLNDLCHFYPQLSDDKFWTVLYDEALKYHVPDSEEDTEAIAEMEDFFALTDQYTGIYLYSLDEGLFLCGKTPPVMENSVFRSFFDFGYRISGGEGESPVTFPLQFKNKKATVHIIFYHSSFFLFPYCFFLLALCIGFFLLAVILFINRKIKQIIVLKNDVLVMAGGDLSRAFPDYHNNEIGILSRELDHLRVAFHETIQAEQASRKANQDLITALSHDLRTPLTILTGYLEVLRLKMGHQTETDYLDRCLEKTKDLKDMTDRMFEYALVFEENETFDLELLPAAFFVECLSDNIDFLRLTGFSCIFETSGCKDFSASVSGDQTLIKRIFHNLFSNVLKYGDKTEAVSVSMQITSDTLQILLKNKVKADHTNIESTQIGLKSVEKMVSLLGGKILFSGQSEYFSVLISFY